MARVSIAAFFPEKSTIKNFSISKPYRQQMVGILKVAGLLSYRHQ
jgi:hypothetical protein